MLKVKNYGSFDNTERMLNNLLREVYLTPLDRLALKGVDALSDATPVDTGKTAASWDYKIIKTKDKVIIQWTNDNVDDNDVPIALLINYGHSTSSGYYIQGLHYIEPTLRPIFDEIANAVWEEVRNS